MAQPQAAKDIQYVCTGLRLIVDRVEAVNHDGVLANAMGIGQILAAYTGSFRPTWPLDQLY